MPVARFITENSIPVPRPNTLRPRNPGAVKNCERARVDERGELLGRVDEVERVAGGRRVEHEQVVAALLVQLVELLHRHVLLRAGHRVRELLVDAVREHGVARRASGACHSISSSKVRLASSIIAHSSPSTSAVRPGVSSLPSSGRPSESASRLAGSMVSTATFLPRAAMPSAIAAEVVVFPTPPEPAQMQMLLRSSQSLDHSASSSSSRQLARARRGPSGGSNRKGRRAHAGRRRPRRSRSSCSRCARRAAMLAQRGGDAARAASPPRPSSALVRLTSSARSAPGRGR